MARPLDDLQRILGYQFKDPQLLKIALTHASTGEEQNYERLEFLGDRVLALVIADFLYHKFPKEEEGDLAKRLASLVQGQTLATLSSRISLGDYIAFSQSEREAGGAENDHILADVFEALIGALYVDGGFEPCRQLIEAHWQDVFFTMKTPPQHPKTEVQEWLQAKGLPLPIYDIVGQSGPDHAPIFSVQMNVKGYEPIIGEGRSRSEAEKIAARDFLRLIKESE
jgi:ribonuclease-3